MPRSAHSDYELPAELDFSKVKVIGVGIDALERHVARKTMRVISLAPDVARDFRTSEEVNEALRLVQRMREIGKSTKRKKSA